MKIFQKSKKMKMGLKSGLMIGLILIGITGILKMNDFNLFSSVEVEAEAETIEYSPNHTDSTGKCNADCEDGICNYGENASNSPEDCSSFNYLPIGHLDGVTETSIFGWAYDKNAGSNPIDVHIYIDGNLAGSAIANLNRPDLVSADVTLDPNHGFTFPTPTNLSIGEHTVQAYAINYPKGVNPELIGSPRIITIGEEPVCGDVNCDGVVNEDDYTLVFNHYIDAEQYPVCSEWAADVNCDGKISLSDSRKISNYVNNPGQYTLECCAIEQTCTDTDGGENIYEKGTTCRPSTVIPGDLFCKTDECLSSTSLKEYYCNGDTMVSKTIACANGCNDGACLREPVLPDKCPIVWTNEQYVEYFIQDCLDVAVPPLTKEQIQSVLDDPVLKQKMMDGLTVTHSHYTKEYWEVYKKDPFDEKQETLDAITAILDSITQLKKDLQTDKGADIIYPAYNKMRDSIIYLKGTLAQKLRLKYIGPKYDALIQEYKPNEYHPMKFGTLSFALYDQWAYVPSLEESVKGVQLASELGVDFLRFDMINDWFRDGNTDVIEKYDAAINEVRNQKKELMIGLFGHWDHDWGAEKPFGIEVYKARIKEQIKAVVPRYKPEYIIIAPEPYGIIPELLSKYGRAHAFEHPETKVYYTPEEWAEVIPELAKYAKSLYLDVKVISELNHNNDPKVGGGDYKLFELLQLRDNDNDIDIYGLSGYGFGFFNFDEMIETLWKGEKEIWVIETGHSLKGPDYLASSDEKHIDASVYYAQSREMTGYNYYFVVNFFTEDFKKTPAFCTYKDIIEEVRSNAVEPICGNGICETGETPENCPEDCSSVINHLPIGYLDGATETSIFGWAYDKNAGSNPIDVHIYIDGKYVGLATANQSRPDLVSAKVALDPNHGFTFPTPTNLSVGEHTAQAYAINYPEGVNPELIGSPRIITIGGEPICGNGVCETGETGYTCQEDCCVDGDGICREGCVFNNDNDCQSIKILQLTNTPEIDDNHVYFNICPWNPSGDKIVWSSFGEKIYESSIIVNGAELEFQKGDIWIMNSDGSNKRIIVKDIREYSPKTSWVPFRLYPIWSTDGKKVYFTSDLVDDDELIMNFHVVDIDTLDIEQISYYKDAGTWIQTVMLSPDGKQLGYCINKDGDLNVDIHFINTDGTNLRKFTKEGDHCLDHPEWSPDGEKIVYSYFHCKTLEWPCPDKVEIRVMNADFTDDRILTLQGSGYNHHGMWGQDSKYYYYNLDNYLMRTDLNGNKEIVADFDDFFPWHVGISPDGTKAVLDTGPRLFQADSIEIIDIDTGAREKVADISGNTYSARPSWNPDGTKILYDFCNEAGNRDLYLVQLTTPKCGNGVCEIGDGETGFTCPEDCCVDGDGICREGCTFANDDDCEEVAIDKAEIVNTLEYHREKGFEDELEAGYYVIAKTWLNSPIENKQEIIDYLDSLQREDGSWGYHDGRKQKMLAFILPVYLAMDAMPKKSLDPFFDSHSEYTDWEAAKDYPCASPDKNPCSCKYHLALAYKSYYNKLPSWMDEFFSFCEKDLTWTTDGRLHFRSHVLYPYLYAGHPYPNHDGIIDATIGFQEPNGSWIDYTRDGFQDTHIQLLLIKGLKILYPNRANDLQIAVEKSKLYVTNTYKTITEGGKTFGYFVGYPGEDGRVSSIWQGVLASICSGLIEGNVDPFFGGPGSVCGNGICETGETPENCPEDCSSVINHLPIGYLDGATETSIFGWAYDKNAGSNPIDVHIYIDGKCVGLVKANESRSDLVTAGATPDPNHGFTFPTPTNLSIGEHTVNVYAINYPKGVNPELIGSPKTITIGGELPISNNILIKTENNPEVYQIVNNKKHWISNPAVFTSYDFSIEDVIIISEAELNLYPQIKLIRNENNNKIYYLNQTPKGILKRHLINPDVFLSYGNKWEDVITVNDIETQSYGNINLIKTKNNPDIYLIQENSKMLISSPEVFSAKGYDWEKVVEVNDIEMNSYEVKSL